MRHTAPPILHGSLAVDLDRLDAELLAELTEQVKDGTITQAEADRLADIIRRTGGGASDNIDHSFEKGRLNEQHLNLLLRGYLPRRFGIGTGLVGSSSTKSHQSDIILYDNVNNAPLYESEAFAVYPIEMVYGVVEVKTNAARLRAKK
jgi:hypothetical protein